MGRLQLLSRHVAGVTAKDPRRLAETALSITRQRACSAITPSGSKTSGSSPILKAMTHDAQLVADYLGRLPKDQRNALEQLRSVIRASVPEATECIRYGVPTYCLAGRPLVSYGASKRHCALYPLDPKVLEAHLEQLTDFEASRGTLRFQSGAPLPELVVAEIVLERAAAIRGDA